MNEVRSQDLSHDLAVILDRVEAGERFVVPRDGQPVGGLRPVADHPRTLSSSSVGLAAGRFVAPDGFADPLPDEILGAFEG